MSDELKERIKAGKALREQVPRAAHADFMPSPGRRSPVELLLEQAQVRVPELVPVRHARMLASPFAFLRGTAALMANDLAHTPDTGIEVQACGDVHVANFGFFASAERHLIFGLNDFDETLPGPWEWDLKRLVVSALVCARHLGASPEKARAAARQASRNYCKLIRKYAGLGYLPLWYVRMDADAILADAPPGLRARAQKLLDKARSRTHTQALGKLTERVDGKYQLLESPPLIERNPKLASGISTPEAVEQMLRSYAQSLAPDRRKLFARYKLVDTARKVVGVGSVGTRCAVALLLGNGQEDPLFLQIKQAQESVLAAALKRASNYANHGRRVVEGQRILQGAPDIFLGWGKVNDVHFYVRQLRNMKVGVELEPAQIRLDTFHRYCGLCGRALALAHAKSGDPALIAGYVGGGEELSEALEAFAQIYADQNETDYQTMAAAAQSGQLQVARLRELV